MLQTTPAGHSPDAIAARFAQVAQQWLPDGPAERAEGARRKLLAAIGQSEPATLNEVAAAVGRGAPAVSRSVDSLVRAGLVSREPDPDHRRRLALRLTAQGRERLSSAPAGGGPLRTKLQRLAHSELRAVERAVEILERGF
jgi:DNA-binding MarR family transcriptional regulator